MITANSLFEKFRQWAMEFLGLTGEVFYISGPETLPPPLSRAEEDEAFRLLVSDKPKGREQLIVHNLRLVVYIAKKFESTGICIDDLVSIGTIGLIKAVNTFSPEKNIKLATYASRCIENEILMFLRKTSQHKNDISIDEPLNIDWDGNELLLSDILGTDEDTVSCEIEDYAEKQVLLKTVSELPERERIIMEMRFGLKTGNELTQKAIAKECAEWIRSKVTFKSNITNEIIGKLGVKNSSKGARIDLDNGEVRAELSITMQYGYSIPKVCALVQERVAAAVRNMTGLEVVEVNVHVVGVNVNNAK